MSFSLNSYYIGGRVDMGLVWLGVRELFSTA